MRKSRNLHFRPPPVPPICPSLHLQTVQFCGVRFLGRVSQPPSRTARSASKWL
ncbi:unnamed protein product [Linum tenue]|uniref:Uncharacterized protein n=1 Tax=Linum tenue TaxID=586396 RepID=A0AAV0QK99_9ROSI|nr:unnamed protein product [Linum tenue]